MGVYPPIAAGGIFTAVTTQTADYTASDGDVVLADASGGAITITLPSPSENAWVQVKKIDSSLNKVTVAQNATETIDGQSSIDLVNQYQSYIVVSDGTDWFVQRYEPNVDLATLTVWETGRTWNIPSGRTVRHTLKSGEYIEGTDTIQGDGELILYKETIRKDFETGGPTQLRLTSQLKVLKENVTWEIPANKIIQMVLPPNGQIEGTDTVQGRGDLLLFEL